MIAQNKDNNNYALSLVDQIVMSISKEIEKGAYIKNQKLLSINTYSKQYGVARDTIEKAYIRLKNAGYISSVKGKGYFVTGNPGNKIKVLLVFNKLSSYKKIIYDSIIETLAEKAKVEIQIHHYDPLLLDEIIDTNLGRFHYYVIMPLFFDGADEKAYVKVLKKIPDSQLILLDKKIPGLAAQSTVFQDYRNDIYEALSSQAHLFNNYQRLVMIFPTDKNYQKAIRSGLRQFGVDNNKKIEIISQIPLTLQKKTAYIALTESDLVELMKQAKKKGLTWGDDIGLISYNDTPFKELLDITVMTTDFEQMGKSTAQMILQNEQAQIKNPFKIVVRKSL